MNNSDFYFYLLTTSGCDYTRNYTDDRYFKRVADLMLKNWAPTNLANISQQKKDCKPGFKEKIKFFLNDLYKK